MLARRLLIAGGGAGSFSPPPPNTTRYALFNGGNGSTIYRIGAGTSSDSGATWAEDGSNPVISEGSGWESSHVKDPCLLWDGSQYVCYYAGWNGTKYRIGRAVSADRVTWTKYGSNPVIGFGAGGDPDEDGAAFPVVYHDVGLSPAWKMWYTGFPAGSTPGAPSGQTVCFADSSDGITWTKRGRVIDVGTSGDFDDSACLAGCVYLSGSTWYVYYTGYRSATNFMHSGYATATDPATAGTYTKQGGLANLTGSIVIASRTWRSNLPRGIMAEGGTYRTYIDLWNPSDASGYEMCSVSSASDLATWASPTTQMFPVPGGGWDPNSIENPGVIVAP